MKKIVPLFLSLAMLTSVSCGNKSDLFPVYGEVYFNGTPAEGALVSFYPKDPGGSNDQMIFAIVQEDGSFELECGSAGKGAPPGDYDVTIEWKPVISHAKGRPQRGPDKLNGRYADPRHALLAATVKSNRNELDAFELKD